MVQITVPILKNIDLSEYRREKEHVWDKYTLVRNIVHRYVCIGMGPLLCRCYVIVNVLDQIKEHYLKETLLWKAVSYWVRTIKNTFTF